MRWEWTGMDELFSGHPVHLPGWAIEFLAEGIETWLKENSNEKVDSCTDVS